jgi:hypothetical protein
MELQLVDILCHVVGIFLPGKNSLCNSSILSLRPLCEDIGRVLPHHNFPKVCLWFFLSHKCNPEQSLSVKGTD